MTLGGTRSTALAIIQRLLATPPPMGGPQGYRFAPGGWLDPAGRLRVSNLPVDPLAELEGPGRAGGVYTLILDITDGWWALHADNSFYAYTRSPPPPRDPRDACVRPHGRRPVIWHALVPKHLVGVDGGIAAPLPPAVRQPRGTEPPRRQGLSDHERRVLQERRGDAHQVPRVADPRRRRRPAGVAVPDGPDRRNVLPIRRIDVGKRKGQITPMQWSIAAGLQRAFATGGRESLRSCCWSPSGRAWRRRRRRAGTARPSPAMCSGPLTRSSPSSRPTPPSPSTAGTPCSSATSSSTPGFSESGFYDLWNVWQGSRRPAEGDRRHRAPEPQLDPERLPAPEAGRRR